MADTLTGVTKENPSSSNYTAEGSGNATPEATIEELYQRINRDRIGIKWAEFYGNFPDNLDEADKKALDEFQKNLSEDKDNYDASLEDFNLCRERISYKAGFRAGIEYQKMMLKIEAIEEFAKEIALQQ